MPKSSSPSIEQKMSSFKGFPKDGKLWRIEAVDDLSYTTDDPKVRVYLAMLKDDIEFNKAFYKASLFEYPNSKAYGLKIIDVKIGFIQLLTRGSVWLNGVQQHDFCGVKESFELSIENTKILKLNSTGQSVDRHEDILTQTQCKFANSKALENSNIVLIQNIKSSITSKFYKKIVIPCDVIFQSCYVSSPKAASKIIFGQLSKLIDLEDSGFLENEKNVYRVHLHKDYRNVEGIMLANLATDPVAKENLQRLRQSIVSSGIHPSDANSHLAEHTRDKTTPIHVNFPFSNPIKIDVIGRPIPYPADSGDATEWGFFVTEIRRVKTNFLFDTILPVRKNDGSTGDEIVENPQEFGSGVKSEGGSPNNEDGINYTEDDVSTFIEQTRIPIAPTIDISEIKTLKHKKSLQKYVSKPFRTSDDHIKNNGNVSTGDATGQGTASGLDVENSPAELTDFLETLKALAAKGIEFETLSISYPKKIGGGVINYFPFKITGHHSWHKTKDKKRTRGFIIASTYYAGRYYYLIDVESKGDHALSIALIQDYYGRKIENKDLEILMLKVAKKNGWSTFQDPDSHRPLIWKHKLITHARVVAHKETPTLAIEPNKKTPKAAEKKLPEFLSSERVANRILKHLTAQW